MEIDLPTFDHLHLLGESATHPSEPCYGTLAALLRLVVAPCQRTASQPTRTRPTAVSRIIAAKAGALHLNVGHPLAFGEGQQAGF